MESPESRDTRSSASPTTLSPRREFPSPYYKEKTTHIRFLATNAEAGSVIGKNGSTIADLQSQSGARIQLSSNHEFFPGTSDRIVMVSGIVDEILKGVELILVKFFNEFYVEDDVDSRTRLRIIAPNSSCGGIIGKGGATIKSFIKDSKAGIKISPQDSNYLGLNDRIITLNGTLEELMRAVELVLMKLGEDPYYSQSSSVPFSYAGFQNMPYTYVFPPPATAAYNAMNFGPMGPVGKFKNNKEDRSNSVTMGVPDDHIGIVVGRGGRNILEISQVSGAKIKISDRGDFMSGTSDRKVTIMGSKRAIRVAEAMISHKIALASSPER